MQKLILILLAFFAVFTFIRVFEKAEASESSAEFSGRNPVRASIEIPMEISR